ncbi:unnamed protein product [Urochloa humidicola]
MLGSFVQEGVGLIMSCRRHGFCWCCGDGEEAHRSESCGMVHAWLEKNSSFLEMANWVLANARREALPQVEVSAHDDMKMKCLPFILIINYI